MATKEATALRKGAFFSTRNRFFTGRWLSILSYSTRMFQQLFNFIDDFTLLGPLLLKSALPVGQFVYPFFQLLNVICERANSFCDGIR